MTVLFIIYSSSYLQTLNAGGCMTWLYTKEYCETHKMDWSSLFPVIIEYSLGTVSCVSAVFMLTNHIAYHQCINV